MVIFCYLTECKIFGTRIDPDENTRLGTYHRFIITAVCNLEILFEFVFTFKIYFNVDFC
jgi:hypothetical protein